MDKAIRRYVRRYVRSKKTKSTLMVYLATLGAYPYEIQGRMEPKGNGSEPVEDSEMQSDEEA